MKIYLASTQTATAEREERMIEAGVIKHKCITFANVVKIPGLPWYLPGVEASLEVDLSHGVGIMMDSGVFSVRTYKRYLAKKGKEIQLSDAHYVELYIEWCLRYAHLWDFYVTIDWTPHQPAIYEMTNYLQSKGLKPVPVFHGDKSVDYLRRYHAQGHTYIAVSASNYLHLKNKRRHLDSIFNVGAQLGIEYHGLALTAPWAVLDYPWKSVDSSSWSRAARYGAILRFDENTSRMHTLHISEKKLASGSGSKSVHSVGRQMGKQIQREIEDEGADYDALRTDFIARHIYNAGTMLKLAEASDKRHRSGGWRDLL